MSETRINLRKIRESMDHERKAVEAIDAALHSWCDAVDLKASEQVRQRRAALYDIRTRLTSLDDEPDEVDG